MTAEQFDCRPFPCDYQSQEGPVSANPTGDDQWMPDPVTAPQPEGSSLQGVLLPPLIPTTSFTDEQSYDAAFTTGQFAADSRYLDNNYNFDYGSTWTSYKGSASNGPPYPYVSMQDIHCELNFMDDELAFTKLLQEPAEPEGRGYSDSVFLETALHGTDLAEDDLD